MQGKQLRIYLVDGVPTGILTAQFINWTGKVVVAPRTQLSELAARWEVRRTGVYCLIGPDPSYPQRERVYIGEADTVMTRLTRHDREEDFWTRVAVVISTDENITKSHGRYLEARLIALARAAGRATVANATSPETLGLLPEPDVADMEFFLTQLQMMFPVLGMSFLVPPPFYDVKDPVEGNQRTRFIMTDVGTKAIAAEIFGEFVVLKGSTARKQGVDSWTSYSGLRQELVDARKLVDSSNSDYFEFAENVSFASPSAAAAVVAGGNRNGRITWKVEGKGETYAQWQEAKLAAVAVKANPPSEEST